MSNDVLTVIYRPHEHADEYLVFVDDEKEYKEWVAQPEGSKSIALSRFIGNFGVVSRPGSQPLVVRGARSLHRPSACRLSFHPPVPR